MIIPLIEDLLQDLTPDRVFEAASRYLPSQDADQLRSNVEKGSAVEAPNTAWGPCVQRESVAVPTFELGMERAKPVKLTVRRGGDTSTITYFPGGHIVGVTPHYVPDQAHYRADPQRCQATSNLH